MPPKPHRILVDRVSGYASEAAAYVRRRRLTREPFARVLDSAGSGYDHRPGSPEGEALQAAAEQLIRELKSNESDERG